MQTTISTTPCSVHGRAASTIKRLSTDKRGAAVMEFGLCAAAFIGLLVAGAQTSLVFFAQQGIQTSAEIMARRIMTGEIRQATMSKEQFRLAACATLPSYMQCSKLLVDARQATTFDGIDTAMPTVTYNSGGGATNLQYSTGSSGSIVILRLLYSWPVSKGPLGFDISNQGPGPRLLIGTMVFQSEPYV